MLLRYLLPAGLTGGSAATYALVQWDVSLWTALAIYSGAGNLAVMAIAAVVLAGAPICRICRTLHKLLISSPFVVDGSTRQAAPQESRGSSIR